ncbi:PTS system, ascorbate-specific IIA component [Andreprevotia lacus DSM 23236]|jgi:PTS system ascorbate-specific IIA component|uniref:PTS system, ascorbate-specific IIA component n=1 Tax=Andreprevotia lacus DSM 23236 TaxID=1121001 RepID=A0A1W1Y299_9NEIS|nr:PTS fructose transporter subunit IIA [Andreprevotia lacus]SMC29911.1 PTS system, ascorbate-specific IIA component [Andreprevotia lacus DSM 23236]
MVGIIIVTHVSLGDALMSCAQHIMGRPLSNVAQLAVSKADDPDKVVERARQMIASLDDGSGVLLLTDIYGGTPSNVANRLIVPGKVEAVAGVNLPMLVRALTYCHQPLETVVSKAITGGLEGVLYMLPGSNE